MLVATTTLIFGVSRLGMAGKLGLGLGLLAISAVAWVAFIRIEKRAAAPILDPQVLFNRTFLTAAGASVLACFGMVGMSSYTPIFVQTVMKLDPTISGSIQTPFTMILAFMGIPTGMLLARTRKYKWIYNTGYAFTTIALFSMSQFSASTPVWLYMLVTCLSGLGSGAVGTVNTLVAQFAVPRRLLGAAVGAMFFFLMVGLSVTPAIIGLVQNSAPTIEAGLKLVFLVGALTMASSLLLILTIPELSIQPDEPEARVEDGLGQVEAA
jgi:MFS family permease